MASELKIPWNCPKCGVDYDGHKKDDDEKCKDKSARGGSCQGFLCDCDDEGTEGHGDSYTKPCLNAVCHHCGWSGTFPVVPKGLQAWEKKALEAGWSPPEKRRQELEAKHERGKGA